MNHGTISITVRLFAAAKDAARLSETTIDLPAPSVAGDVLSHFAGRFPSMKELAPFVRIAVNEEYVDLSFRLSDGDEVALLPPVSGG